MLICIGFYEYNKSKDVPIATIPDVSPSSVFVGMSKLGIPIDFKESTKILAYK